MNDASQKIVKLMVLCSIFAVPVIDSLLVSKFCVPLSEWHNCLHGLNLRERTQIGRQSWHKAAFGPQQLLTNWALPSFRYRVRNLASPRPSASKGVFSVIPYASVHSFQ